MSWNFQGWNHSNLVLRRPIASLMVLWLLQICTHYPPLFPILSKFKCEFVKAMAPFTVVQHLFVIQNHFGFSCLFRVGTLGDHYWILASSFYRSRNSSSSLFPALKRKEKRETNFNKDLKQDRSSFDLVYQKLKIVHNARPKNPNNIPSKITHKMEKSKRSTNTYSKC